MNRLLLWRLMASATAAFFACAWGMGEGAASAASYTAYAPMPSGTVLVTRPCLTWRVMPTGGCHITHATVTLNDIDIPATYNTDKATMSAEPGKSLTPGTYQVKCRLYFDDTCTIDQQWSFMIAKDAIELLPEPNAAQHAVLDSVNKQRRSMGLPALQLDPHLCAAASAHSEYMHRNEEFGHVEDITLIGFTGVAPIDRVAAYGYDNANYEDVDSGSIAPVEFVRDLFDAPYHRAPFMQPGAPDFGTSTVGDKTTMEFGVTTVTDTVVYPRDGQQNVVLQWEDKETPDPLRLYSDASTIVGYVITLFHFSTINEHVRVTSGTLSTSDGTAVPILLNTPANDSYLSNGVLLIPKHPLLPHTKYTASVNASTTSGLDISRTWSFTTGDGADTKVNEPSTN